MKKILLSLLILPLILITLPNCKGTFDVQPRELFLSMNEKFVSGNTSEIILVSNTQESEINISWYIDYPSPDLIRQNRTAIPDISWIDLEPKWKIIPPYQSAEFFINLYMPNDTINLNKNYEAWITFKEEESGFIKFEHAVRFYIDTPISKEFESNIITFSVLIFIVIMVLLFIIKFYKKRKQN
jgi:hypothetical protein